MSDLAGLPALARPVTASVKLDRSPHSGRIAAVLREAIVRGELDHGTAMVETKLAEHFGVSRGPIRSALLMLEGEGLISTPPNGRMEVAAFGAEQVADLFAVRFELESRALRWGIQRHNDPAPVSGAFALMREEGSSTERLVELDIAFHRALVEFSGSPALVRAWLSSAVLLQTIISVGNHELRTQDPAGDFERIMEQHGPLVDAIVERKVRRAVDLLEGQFDVTKNMIRTVRRDEEG
jgi:GntR family transcriptional regulator, gluconate operon transcriptional repressor